VLVRTLLSSNYVVDHRLNLCRLIVDELIRGARVRLVTGSTSRANVAQRRESPRLSEAPFPASCCSCSSPSVTENPNRLWGAPGSWQARCRWPEFDAPDSRLPLHSQLWDPWSPLPLVRGERALCHACTLRLRPRRFPRRSGDAGGVAPAALIRVDGRAAAARRTGDTVEVLLFEPTGIGDYASRVMARPTPAGGADRGGL